MLFNNAGSIPELIAKANNGKIIVVDIKLFERIKESAR